MPNVILEAMACGLPAVTTRFKGFSGAFGRDGKELIITTHEKDQIADDLQKISTSEVYQNIQRNGLQWIKDHQDLENVLDQYANLFKNLLFKG
jgi:glycosyltransferase involved in cell wall biosynthesis